MGLCRYDNGPQISISQLFEWNRCVEGGALDCSIFHNDHPNTMSLSVLVLSPRLQVVVGGVGY